MFSRAMRTGLNAAIIPFTAVLFLYFAYWTVTYCFGYAWMNIYQVSESYREKWLVRYLLLASDEKMERDRTLVGYKLDAALDEFDARADDNSAVFRRIRNIVSYKGHVKAVIDIHRIRGGDAVKMMERAEYIFGVEDERIVEAICGVIDSRQGGVLHEIVEIGNIADYVKRPELLPCIDRLRKEDREFFFRHEGIEEFHDKERKRKRVNADFDASDTRAPARDGPRRSGEDHE